MPRFYTHVLRGTDYANDVEGQEFASTEEARESARRGARITVAYEIKAGRDPVELEYHIHDEAGTKLATFRVSATVTGLD
jgi:hypothetical protein